MIKYLKPLHLICINDENMPNLALIQIKKKEARATNGHLMIKLDLVRTSKLTEEQLDILEGKYLHMEVWKEMYKCDQIDLDDVGITVHKNGITKSFDYSHPVDEWYDLDKTVSEVKYAGEHAVRLVAYNPAQIAKIATVFDMGGSPLFISHSPEPKGHVVTCGHDTGMMAIVMPILISDENLNRYMF